MNIKMKRIIPVVFFVFTAIFVAKAQQIPNWSSYYENGFIWNPALTGYWNVMEVSVTHRQDWSDFEDAPEHSTIGIQIPLLRRVTRVSMGGYIERDRVGPYSKHSLVYSYSYRIVPRLFGNRLDQLRLGVAASVSQFNYNPNNLTPFDGFEGDPIILDQSDNRLGGNVTIGAFYVSIDDFNNFKTHYYAGVSINHLLPGTIGSNPLGDITAKPHATLHLGYRYLKSRRSTSFVEPNLMITYSPDNTVNAMANIRHEKKESYWLSFGAVYNGDYFLQVGIILNEDTVLGSFLENGTMRLGVKANQSVGEFQQYRGNGFEASITTSWN